MSDSDATGNTIPFAEEESGRLGSWESASSEPDGDRHGSSEFIRVIPYNHEAILAFDELATNIEALHHHHRRYIVVNGKTRLSNAEQSDIRSGGETTNDESGHETEGREIDVGYFRIGFDFPSFSNANRWVIGRGSAKKYGEMRNVDVLLALPQSRSARGLAAAHAFLKMHPTSGAWMLGAGLERTPTSTSLDSPEPNNKKVAPLVLDGRDIWHGSFHCLSLPRSLLEVAGMHFWVQFTIDTPEKERTYTVKRDEKLREKNLETPDSVISGIPFESDIAVRPLVVFRHGLGSGSFGAVFEGFDLVSGDLRVIKEVIIKEESRSPVVAKEIQANLRFGNSPGLVRLYDWQNSNGEKEFKSRHYPLKVYLIQEKGKAFDRYLWPDGTIADWGVRSRLFHQLLEGLTTIHDLGWMHRDITPMNILYFGGSDQARAALCDFGKICYDRTDTDTRLAAWKYLPPEIQEGENKAYDQSIDIWMLALSLVYMWYPQLIRGLDARNRREHHELCLRLSEDKTASRFTGLLCQMLSWNFASRPLAREALGDECFRNAELESDDVEHTSDGKRVRRVGGSSGPDT